MKVLSTPAPHDCEELPANEISLPSGLIGFGDYRRGELLYLTDHLPFLWLKLSSKTDCVRFVVIEPGGVIPDYQPEIFDADAEALGLKDMSEALVLNIVTLRHQQPVEATVNLLGPIVVNRRTRIGRQLVLANHSSYSAHHPLVENSPTVACAASA